MGRFPAGPDARTPRRVGPGDSALRYTGTLCPPARTPAPGPETGKPVSFLSPLAPRTHSFRRRLRPPGSRGASGPVLLVGLGPAVPGNDGAWGADLWTAGPPYWLPVSTGP